MSAIRGDDHAAVVVVPSGALQVSLEVAQEERRQEAWFLLLPFLSPFILMFAYFDDRNMLLSIDFVLLFLFLAVLYFFIVRFITRVTHQDQRLEIRDDGIDLKGSIPRRTYALWTQMSQVDVRTARPNSPNVTFFTFRGLGNYIQFSFDERTWPGLAERIASATARFGPQLRRTGDVARLRWNPAGPVEGTGAAHSPGSSANSFLGLSIFWAFICLLLGSFAAAATSNPLIQNPGIRLYTVLAYSMLCFASLIVGQVYGSRTAARGAWRASRALRVVALVVGGLIGFILLVGGLVNLGIL